MTITHRFDMREERDGTWTVFDIFTKLPVELNGVKLMCLTIDEADEAVDLVAYIDTSWQQGFRPLADT